MIFHRHRTPGILDEVTVCPLGDIQWNGDEEEVWLPGLRKHIAWTLTLPNPLYIGLGDYTDLASPSGRQKLKAAGLYKGPQNALDMQANALTREVYEILKPTKGRWLGMLSGHHVWEYMANRYKNEYGNSDEKLADLLDAPYLGFGGTTYRLTFSDGKTNTRDLWLWAHHGCGAGQKAYSPLTKLENLSGFYEGIDLFVMGHQTKRPHVPVPKMYPVAAKNGTDAGKFRHRDVHLAGSGGWSKGYLESTVKAMRDPSYVELGLMNPVALGAPVVHIRPSWNEQGGDKVWMPNIKVEG